MSLNLTEPQEESLLAQLSTAKDNVRWLLDHSEGSVDMLGLSHWAGVVERLRLKIRESL